MSLFFTDQQVWHVLYWDENQVVRCPFFWTWEAALDFAVDQALRSRRINHIHLWQ